jgi:hypothetical protein
MLWFLKQNAGIFTYQDVMNWSLQEFFNWISINNELVQSENAIREQEAQKAKLNR